MNLWAIFITGLTTGGLTCVAMQGGLLTSVISNHKKKFLDNSSEKQIRQHALHIDKNDWLPVASFLIAKLISHVILGFLLGWLGSKLQLSLTVTLLFQGIAAFFMLAAAANLLELHPIFRFVVFQPPKFIQKRLRSIGKDDSLFAPALLGLFTVFVPCGVTQSMEVLAISSASPVLGALIMGVFVLGTSPIFTVVGVATAQLSDRFRTSFLRIAAISLLFLGMSSLNGILVVLDAPVTFQKMTQPITYFFSNQRFAEKNSLVKTEDGKQKVTIEIQNSGYSPRNIEVKAGVPVELTLHTNNVYSCATSFVMKAFDIKAQLGPIDQKTFSFTPEKKGEYTFACSMGMYTGTLKVI